MILPCLWVEKKLPLGTWGISPLAAFALWAQHFPNRHFLFFSCQAMAIINGSLYVFGGTTGYIYSTDLHKLDLNTREWTQLKPNNMHCDMPEER